MFTLTLLQEVKQVVEQTAETAPVVQLWIFYLLGIFIALSIKFICYTYDSVTKYNTTFKEAVKTWFLEHTVTNAVSWMASIVNIVTALVIGRFYINKIADIGFVKALPLDIFVALLLGLLSEYIVPSIIKWILSLFPGAKQVT